MSKYAVLLRTWESNYGCSDGWIVERHGQPIALLTDPLPEDMFWMSYRINALTEDAQLAAAIMTDEFWLSSNIDDFAWCSRALDLTVDHAVWSGKPIVSPGRINMWMLYFPVRPPHMLDHVVLGVRRLFSRVQRA